MPAQPPTESGLIALVISGVWVAFALGVPFILFALLLEARRQTKLAQDAATDAMHNKRLLTEIRAALTGKTEARPH